MTPTEDLRTQIAKFSRDFYAQALNLTLSNPLLRLPSGARSAKFLELTALMTSQVANAIGRDDRSVSFIGHGASPAERQLAIDSQQPGARGTLRIELSLPHERVDAILRTIAKKHDELLERRGLPCAFLAMGVLKWKADDDKETRSPLLLIPVDIDQEFDTTLRRSFYRLTPTDRIPIANPVLGAYLKLKHQLSIPEFDGELELDGAKVTSWLKKEATKLTSTKPSWAVMEDVVFGLFDCGAIAADCDASNWSPPLDERQLLTDFFTSTYTATDPPVDQTFTPPSLVLEADGSQLEALQVVSKGNSIVLHGPPGSGKSQTIVNLIAQALSNEKSVLFIAQKPEAAHVVQRRLAERGLMPFCTMLVPTGDSRNTKTAILEGLRQREMVQPPAARALAADRARLEQNVSLLNRHAQALCVVMPQFGISAREMLAELALHTLKDTPAIERADIAFPSSIDRFITAEESLTRLASVRNQISDQAFSVIGGVRPKDEMRLAHDAAFELLADCRTMTKAARSLRDMAVALEQDGCAKLPRSIDGNAELTKAVPQWTALLDTQTLQRVFRLRQKRTQDALKRMASAQARLSDSQVRVQNCRDLAASTELGTAKSIANAGSLLVRYQAGDRQIATLPKFSKAIEGLQADMAQGDEPHGNGPIRILLARAEDFKHWQRLVALLDALYACDNARTFLIGRMERLTPTVNNLQTLKEASNAVTEARTRAAPICLSDRLPSPTDLRIAQAAIASRVTLGKRIAGCITDRQYRSAKGIARHVLLPTVTRNEWATALSVCIELQAAEHNWNQSLQTAGVRPDSPTDPAAWAGALEWLQRVVQLSLAAQVSPSDAWEAAIKFEQQTTDSSELDILTASGRICRATALRGGLEIALTGTTPTFKAICNALNGVSHACATVGQLAATVGLDESATVAAVTERGIMLAELRDTVEAINSDAEARELFGEDFKGIDTPIGLYERDASWLRESQSARYRPWRDTIEWCFSEHAAIGRRVLDIQRFMTVLAAEHQPLSDAVQRFRENHFFDGSAAAIAVGLGHDLDAILRAADVVLENQGEVHTIFDLGIKSLSCADIAGNGIIRRFHRSEISASELVPCYRRAAFEAALRDNVQLGPLMGFDRIAIDDAVASLPALDQSIRDSNAKLLVGRLLYRQSPKGVATGRIRDYTELGYIKHLMGLQRPRFEVQDLLTRSGAALRALQPCIIATPSAVSEFLPRNAQMFDLLIIDEASQIPPSYAFGSIARSKQAVIVGDPKQLPPTAFFMGTTPDTDEDDEDSGVTDVESILVRAISSLRNVHLCGHYRSRHHSLIAFSNKHFYDQRLVVTPSVAPRSSKLGIVAHYLQNAKYDASRNEIEAKTVAEHAMKHLCSGSGESLGIVAFNAPQAALIETHLEAIAGESQSNFDAYSRARTRSDSLFIRNLESVQGDERDVIFISYTYGPDAESGHVYQRFGPVDRSGGERRLNVLVTRAKNRVEVFHSLRPDQITSTSSGGKIMRQYLEYARQAPEFDFADGAFESGFEEEVARAIERMAPNLIVRPQVSCDKFRIDIGLALRTYPDRFILGIECDGATYHSSRNARDRDLIRQSILEHHGWKIHRIWSTAWWKNSASELKRLTDVVTDAITREEARAL